MTESSAERQRIIKKIQNDSIYGSAYTRISSVEEMKKAGFLDDGLPSEETSWQADANWLITPLDKVRKNLARVDANDTNELIVLLSTGAFCPLHKSHIEMMEIAKNEFESQGAIVLGGYFSPSHDNYVSPKCHNEALKALHRLHLCEQALLESDWLMVDAWESLYIDRAVNFSDVILRLENYLATHLNSHKAIRVVYVFGSDNASFARAFISRGYCVCIQRPGYEDKFNEIADDLLVKNNSKIIFVKQATAQPGYSSTHLRRGDEKAMIESIKDTFRSWQNITNNSFTAAIENDIYYLRNEGEWTYSHWINPANSSMVKDAWIEFLHDLTACFQQAFRNVQLPDVPLDLKVRFLDLKEQRKQAASHTKGEKIISLDPCIEGDFNLGVSRCFSFSTSKCHPELVARPGWQPLETQIQSIPPGEYILLDDDIATGTTIRKVISLLPKNIQIKRAVSMVQLINSKISLEQSVVENEKPLDISDCRDFLLGSHEGGLVITLPDGTLARAPYMLPYVFPSDRASSPISCDLDFSIALWKINERFFSKIKPFILLSDASLSLQELMYYLGFKPSDSLQSICRWHIDKLTASLNQ